MAQMDPATRSESSSVNFQEYSPFQAAGSHRTSPRLVPESATPSASAPNGGAPLYSNFDQNHEGHSGWTADQIQSNVTAWANLNKPDVVLLHIGTNDISLNQSNSSTINESCHK